MELQFVDIALLVWISVKSAFPLHLIDGLRCKILRAAFGQTFCLFLVFLHSFIGSSNKSKLCYLC